MQSNSQTALEGAISDWPKVLRKVGILSQIGGGCPHSGDKKSSRLPEMHRLPVGDNLRTSREMLPQYTAGLARSTCGSCTSTPSYVACRFDV